MRARAAALAAVLPAAPAAALVGVAWLLAWVEHGSIEASDWLPYALFAGGLLAAVLLSGRAARPTRSALVGCAGLVALAAWAAASIAWSPAPSLARDEALLTLLYAVAFAVPALTLTSEAARRATVAAVVAGSGALALATAALLRFGAHPLDAYHGGRLYSLPISYGPAQSAFCLLALWPALVLAARRDGHVAGRALAFGAGVACTCDWLLAQSRAGAIGLAVAAAVVLAVSPKRLRLLVPALLVGGFAAGSFRALTAPYGKQGDAYVAAIRHAGGLALWLPLAAVAAGAAYALLDRALSLSPATRRWTGRAAALAAATAVAVAAAAFLRAEPHPGAFVIRHWQAFKTQSQQTGGTSHFSDPGSNRYDFWRVALHELRAHPLTGIGARGFGAAYLQHRHSRETPARAHSLPLEVLAEDGVVGFALLVLALGAGVAVAVRGARRSLPAATAVLGGGAYWLGHAAVDWTWTFPAVGIPFFVLLGVAASGDGAARVRGRGATLAAVAAALVALVAFLPPWLAARYTAAALASPAHAASDLRRAERLDPLSTAPYVVAWYLAPTPRRQLAPLRTAVRLEPRSAGLLLLLGQTYLAAHDRRDAARVLARAHLLDPHEASIAAALRRARG